MFEIFTMPKNNYALFAKRKSIVHKYEPAPRQFIEKQQGFSGYLESGLRLC
jgi:hypothetical protein